MEKSPDAFRTISEVAEWLDIPTHVLRFWESRFSQIKPVKRAGGRRYYRPSDMRLIGGVKTLLHDQGMTIRGVQKLLREQGIKHVSSFSQPLEGEAHEAPVVELNAAPAPTPAETPAAPAPTARETHAAEPAPEPAPPEPHVEADEDQPDMFGAPPSVPMPTFIPSRSRPSPAAEAPAPPVAVEEPPKPTIPATPDVPATDPADDDGAYSDAPSVAARLAVAPAAQLARHRETLKAAQSRLQALLDAQS